MLALLSFTGCAWQPKRTEPTVELESKGSLEDKTLFKCRMWQRMKKVDSLGPIAVGYWLSTDPNHRAADLNDDKDINFVDYATYLRMKGI